MRHTPFPPYDARRRFLLHRAAIALAVTLAALLAFYCVGMQMEHTEPPPEAYGELDGRFSPTRTLEANGSTYAYYENRYMHILLIGVDEEGVGADGAYRSGGQADFLLLLSIDRNRKTITPVHIDRDTMAQVPVYGPFGDAAGTRTMQLCLAHAFGSSEQQRCENTAQAVSNLLGGVRIDHYLSLSMDGIARLNDALGGVLVTLNDDFSHLDPAMLPGVTLTLQGKQAEYYVRGRYGVGDNTNAGRMARQRTFIEAAIRLFSQQAEQNAAFAAELLETLSPFMHTTLTSAWLMDHTYPFTRYARADVQALEGTHTLGQDGFIEFHPDQQALTDLLTRLIYEKEP